MGSKIIKLRTIINVKVLIVSCLILLWASKKKRLGEQKLLLNKIAIWIYIEVKRTLVVRTLPTEKFKHYRSSTF